MVFSSKLDHMNVNKRNYRWSESFSKVCQMCDMRVDETVKQVVLKYDKYERDRREIMQEILTELGHNWDERVEKTGRDVWCCCWD